MQSADDLSYRRYFGARKSMIERWKHLYEQSYFENESLAIKRKIAQQQEMQRIGRYFDLSCGGNILDIGCGTGEFLSLFNENWKKYGIEVSHYARAIAEKKGVITTFELQDDFFDLIVFRGTIQHIPDPISRIGECFFWLKRTGGLVLLATPNTNSMVYRLFGTLPMIAPAYNFLLPSDRMLEQILTNFGFDVLGFEYPYLSTPYARPVRDMFFFFLKLLHIRKNISFAFYRNILECYARKP